MSRLFSISAALVLASAVWSCPSGWCPNAMAAKFRLTTDPSATCSAIEVTGEIKPGDYEKFVATAKEAIALAPLRRLYLNSEGGNIVTAMAITEVTRNLAPTVETIVRSRHICNSACNIILTVGANHYVSTRSGLWIHQAFNPKTGKRDPEITKKIGVYLAANGMPAEVVTTMGNLKKKSLLAITPANARKLGFGSFTFYRGKTPPATPQCTWKGTAAKFR